MRDLIAVAKRNKPQVLWMIFWGLLWIPAFALLAWYNLDRSHTSGGYIDIATCVLAVFNILVNVTWIKNRERIRQREIDHDSWLADMRKRTGMF